MKNSIISGILLILALVVIYFIFMNSRQNYDKKALEKTIDSLNLEISNKEIIIKNKESDINTFKDKIDQAQKIIDSNNAKIKRIYIKHEIQIRDIDSYDVVQLEQFFANRYRDTSGTK